MPIYNYGSINIDHVYRVPHLVLPGETLSSHHYRQVLGGKGANQSIALARAGSEVFHIGRYNVADQALVQPLIEAGVAAEHLETVNEPSGHAIIQVDDQAENSIILYAGANHSFTVTDLANSLQAAKAGDWLLLQNECSCTQAMIELAAARGLKIAFNPAPMNAAVKDLPLDKLSLLFVNQVEVCQLLNLPTEPLPTLEDLVALLQARWPDTLVVITLGSKGAASVYQGQLEFVPAVPVQAVDTTGAGDTFTGYFLHAWMQGQSLRAALERAGKASALCVQRVGASSSIPTAAEVDAFKQ
ncbi:ribokinase [uncultured Thiothrix sp.]|uniref:ribokinase n=1 Tax=uncultured Thiothrix sp. TaxID=223185 RepID=UPI0026233A97|nr:ribokinase [uncultured Thiothrix sp.]HMT92474.1 ribokinase [Thiolinea sp.]